MHHHSINLYITTITTTTTTTTTNTMSITFNTQAEHMAYLMNEKVELSIMEHAILTDTLKNYQDLMDKIDALVPEDERNSDWEEGGTIKGLYEYIKNLREEAAEPPDEE